MLGVDLRERPALFVPGDLAFRRVPLGHGQVRRGADLLGHRQHPFDQPLDPGAGRQDLAAVEVDQLAREPVPDRAPGVLLDQPVRMARDRLAFVDRPRDPRRERDGERSERLRLAELGLAVADPDLDGREREVRADAPPELRVLGHRAGVVEKADVPLEPRPSRRTASGTPQRGKKRVKICVLAECSPVTTFSTNGELADSASSSGRNARSPLWTAIARSAPRIPTWTWKPKVLLRQTT